MTQRKKWVGCKTKKESNEAPEEIVGVEADIASHSWHTLTVRAVDNQFAVSLDGVWMFTGFDKTLSRAAASHSGS